jgi:four helix bundle protein
MGYQHLKDRTFRFAADSIKTVRPLLQDPLGRHMAGQIIRSSTSVAANYEAASNAQSRAAFASKVAIVGEEASETAFWFRLFVSLGLVSPEVAEPLIREARELTSIAVASAQTARGRRRPPTPQAPESA